MTILAAYLAFMGAIMVVGIVHKNDILMLDSQQHFSEQGCELKEAIFQAGRRRLRPILMTALATVFGMLPLALGVGSGAQMLQPLAIAVIGGVTVSMVLSLPVTPVIYYQLRRGSNQQDSLGQCFFPPTHDSASTKQPRRIDIPQISVCICQLSRNHGRRLGTV